MDERDPASDEGRIARWVEAHIGPVTAVDRQGRWRPAWFVDCLQDGVVRKLYVRGDRAGDWPPMPLRYECDVFRLFGEQGVRVPHVHGFIEEIPAIVMDFAPGIPGVAHLAGGDRAAVLDQLVDQMLAIHNVEPDRMAAIGAQRLGHDDETALAYYRLIENLFTGNRVAPAPAAEFVRRWLNRNVPVNSSGICPIAVDAAQFVAEGGRLTAMLDFEFACLGDFHTDLAALRIRSRAEDLGDVDALIRRYAMQAGKPIDYHRVRYHTAVIAILTPLQVARELAQPSAGIDYHEYLIWDSFCTLIALDSIAEMQGWPAEPFAEPTGQSPSRQAASLTALGIAIKTQDTGDQFGAYQRDKNARIVAYLTRADAWRLEFERDYLDDAQALLGQRPADWREADKMLEDLVCRDDPALDRALVGLFARRYLRQCFLLADPDDQVNLTQLTTRMRPLDEGEGRRT